MQFVVHRDPVGRAASHHIARADLAPFGLDGRVEQLWLRALNDGSHQVACIPFAAYGIALGDTVLLDDEDYVSEVVGTAWHRTLRLVFVPGLPADDLRAAADGMRAETGAAGLLSEWEGDRLVAVDVPPDVEPAGLLAVMGALVEAGHARWEWADAMPFAARS
ncbi:DUF4265 domain-containing protein [Kitasatospora sp. NPDC101447]|uniref:DUF4265 domain-containing protein n=1 Tax=Kitasatospora sp. NPDC101447 TaxID=3364102 RepID=UPI00381BBBE3